MAPWPRAASSGPAPGRADLTSRWALLLAAALGLALSGSALAGPLEGDATAVCLDAAPARACSASIEATFDASFSPGKLAKSKQTPISLRAAMGFGTSDGSRPPALHEFDIGVDRHARLSLKDVPVCRTGFVDEPPIQQRCKEALIGTGKMVTDIRFPETTIPPVYSEVTVYNGGLKKGKRVLLAAAYLTTPTPATIIVTIVVERDAGRYGLKLAGLVPKIAGGSGSVTHLGLRFRKGVFSAACADRHLQADFKATFVDGTLLEGTVWRDCTPAP